MTRDSKLQKTPTVEARSAMHASYGGGMRRLFEWIFGPIDYPPEAAERVQVLASKGVVVYVAQASSTLLGLYFNHALNRWHLPLPRFVAGINLLIWQPLSRVWELLRQKRSAPQGRWVERYPDGPPKTSETILAEITEQGAPSFLFLAAKARGGRTRRTLRRDYLRALIAVQRVTDRPIYLVPHVLVDRTQAGSKRRGLTTRLFGDGRHPGRVREFFMLLSTYRHAHVIVTEPISLAELCEDNPEADDSALARKAQYQLGKRIRDEERVVMGPERMTRDVMMRHVLRNSLVQDAIDNELNREPKEGESQESRAALKKKSASYVAEIAANYSPRALRVMDRILNLVFNRIYDGILVDEEGLHRALDAARTSPLVYCPTHRSHIDYLVLSAVLWAHGVAPPHVAAGANLSFWPLGPIFRRGGAFFLRRTFRENKLYAAVFRSYVAEMLHRGTSLEFFPEGTRSRTGKLLMPRFGMFTMLVDAWRHGAQDDVQFIPVSIDYERIIEAKAYERELLGGEKQPEDISGLLKSTQVLRSKYGRVHLQFGEPISLKGLASAQGLPQSGEPEHDDPWRLETERLGYRVMRGMAMVGSVTPTSVIATALLAHQGRGLAENALLRRGEGVVEYLEVEAARLSDSLQNPVSRTAALRGAVQRLAEDGLVAVDRAGSGDSEPIYRVPEDRRVRLDYYKNALMNYFAPAAIVARTLRRREEDERRMDLLHPDVRFVSRLFKREFVYRVDAAFDSHFEDTLANLAIRGILDVQEDGKIDVRDSQRIEILAGLLDGFVEAYWITSETLKELRSFPLWHKELETRAMERCRRAFLEGTIRRPEAANRTVISNAVGWFLASGVLQTKPEGKRKALTLSESYNGDALDTLVDEIGSYV